jgi:F0F1-type ATP synthase delta subunit
MAEAGRQFVLPASVVEPADLSRVQRELESVDDFLREASIRKSDSASTLPKTTKGLHDLAEVNHLNLLQAEDRAKADKALDTLQSKAPVVHLSLATDPSAAFVSKIVTYLRQNVHPYLLVQIGLQPTIAGGCLVRTENKVFDFSLRQHMRKHKDLLIKALADMREHETPAAQTSAQPAPQPATAPTAPPSPAAPQATPASTALTQPLEAGKS